MALSKWLCVLPELGIVGKKCGVQLAMLDRQRLFSLVEKDTDHSVASITYDCIMVVMIAISIIPLMFKTQNQLFLWFDRISVAIFIFDYFARWITADLKFSDRNQIVAFVTYPFSLMAMVDLLSILPSIGILSRSFKIFRITRLFKLLRVLKFLRYSSRIQILLNVFKKERYVLLTVLAIAVFYIFTTALIMFNVELNKPNKDGLVVFDSFFDALYWATTTLTTVGYGDVYPVSDFGRVISMMSSIFGIAIIALPSGVITAGYLDELKRLEKDNQNEEN